VLAWTELKGTCDAFVRNETTVAETASKLEKLDRSLHVLIKAALASADPTTTERLVELLWRLDDPGEFFERIRDAAPTARNRRRMLEVALGKLNTSESSILDLAEDYLLNQCGRESETCLENGL
jgi:hypothetical protein